ncbi:MAG TPA: hypothetical protein VL172_01580 [Kofleriaceae bacterium]|nr:hypothetical protein [Kofleriaceae bacterium]
MRWLLVLVVVAVGGVAHAQPRAGSYEVSYQAVADDCAGQGMSLAKGTVSLSQPRDSQLEVDIAGAGKLSGTRNANGRFKAQGPGSPAGDLTVRLSVSGRAGADDIQLIFIAEFYRGKKPVCTQSWSGQGHKH